MEQAVSVGAIAVSCVGVLAIMLMKQRAEFLLGMLVRMVTGSVGIFFLNDMLAKEGISLAVGINPVSLLTTGTLGFSGVVLLYAVLACKFL